ncbi:RDD family protein [Streptomyces sp. NBC_00083]|uniref:RDD family protein n=1 Tax=Streptomyces sp. NBC_00083 TaxID=2975647 RepID=UPI00225353B0|nr:RDD family protein [Streptomyces sp. NBC_00083]MCX5382100.1 RDD family protein [Streptomyces sp. NBC_00083]
MSALVTGDAVVLGLRPARLPSRAMALVIDLAVVWAAYIAISLVMLFATASMDSAARAAIAVALFLLVLVGAPIAVETLSHGRSLGKLACGLRVVRDDGGPIRFRHALMRGAMAVVEILMTFGVVACVASLVSERGRRIGDVFAGTLVVRERVSSGSAGAVPPPPPWLVGRFASLDLSRVPDELWLAVRQYLMRMRQLDPQVGWTMATRLAEDLSARTGAPRPDGVQPAAYLAAVVSERQARDARRAFAGRGVVAGGGRAGVPVSVYGPASASASAPASGFGVSAPTGGPGVPSGYVASGAAPGWTPAPGLSGPAPAPGWAPAHTPGGVSAPATAPAPAPGGSPADASVEGAVAASASTPLAGAAGAQAPGVEGAGRAGEPTRSTGFAPPA